MLKKQLNLFALSLSIASTSLVASERADKAWQLIEQGAQLIDVRTQAEYNSQHLAGSINYPLNELSKYLQNIDKNKTIVIYCRSGRRSERAIQYLTAQGFSKLYNAGGLTEMQRSKLKNRYIEP